MEYSDADVFSKASELLKSVAFHIRTIQFQNDIFRFKNHLRNFVLCSVLKWSSSKIVSIFEHGRADRANASNLKFIILTYA